MKVAVMRGRENSFPNALVEKINAMNAGVTAEFCMVGGTSMGEASPYRVILDRISSGRNLAERRAHARRPVAQKRRELLIGLGIVTVGIVIARLARAEQFPDAWTYSLREPVNSAVGWLRDNVRNGVPVIGGSSAISDFLVLRLLEPLHERLVHLLQSAPPASFVRQVVHPESCPMTLDSLLGIYAWHGRHHAAHITGLRDREGWR